jgi:hypothetical protein
MNAARHRRQALKKRIEKQRKLKETQVQKDFKEMGELRCRHKVLLSRSCHACDENFKPLIEEYNNRPETMERKLRHGFGLDRLKRALVFTKLYGTKIKIVSIWLSTHHPTQQIMDMRKNGFWAMDCGYLTWFSGDSITEVCFDNEWGNNEEI